MDPANIMGGMIVPILGGMFFCMGFHINIPKVIERDDQQKIEILKYNRVSDFIPQ